MVSKLFVDAWNELLQADFFSMKVTKVLPKTPTGDKLDLLCRSVCDANGEFSSTSSYFEKNMQVSVVGSAGLTKFLVTASRPFYDEGFRGVINSTKCFKGEGESFEAAILDLYSKYVSSEEAVQSQPVHIKSQDGFRRVVNE